MGRGHGVPCQRVKHLAEIGQTNGLEEQEEVALQKLGTNEVIGGKAEIKVGVKLRQGATKLSIFSPS